MVKITFGLVLACLMGWSQTANAQITSYFGQVSGSYITNQDDGMPLELEYSLRTAVGLNLGERWTAGLKVQQVFFRGLSQEYQHAALAGPFGRYGWVVANRGRLYLESGLYYGNYCTCAGFTGFASKESGLVYLSFGGGLELRVWKGIFLEAGYTTHDILNHPRPKYGYNTYLLGLVFRLNEKRSVD